MLNQAFVPIPFTATIGRYRIAKFEGSSDSVSIEQKLITMQTYSGQEALFQPHLVELAQGEDVDYVTLSHCWGAKQIITTTQETLRSRLAAIPWKDLSKTFQDAIIITNNLGYRYIWIDSLCIIQNDYQDWELESKNMASIYQNSILTIAASKSKDGDGGCFASTPDLPGKEVLHPYTESPTRIFYRRQLAHSPESLQTQREGEVTSGDAAWPLCERAWTFQEELLSARILFYGPEEIIWQCNTTLCCQCGTINPAQINADTSFVKAYYASGMSSSKNFVGSPMDHQKSLQSMWYKLVLGYSSRFLTKESDRLPALSGLMKQIQAAGLAPLVAGVPANNVHPWLLWKSLSRSKEERVTASYIAPSWSWLSHPSGNRLLFQDRWLSKVSEGLDFVLEPIAQVLDITAEPAGLDPTGALKSGRLILYSFAYACKIEASDFPGVPWWAGLDLRRGRYKFVNNDGSFNFDSMSYQIQLDYQQHTSLKLTLARALYESPQEVLCVLVSRTPAMDGDSDNVFGLVLRAVERSVYERVGTFECVTDKSGLPWPGFKLQEITII